jgi:UDP-N-acetylbacillosamine N-acetyltransferase
MSNTVYIYGKGGHGRVVQDFFPADYPTQFVEDRAVADAIRPEDIPEGSLVVVAIGNNFSRQDVVHGLLSDDKSLIFPTVTHLSAEVSDRADIGDGGVICAKSVVIAGAYLGEFVIVNTGATVDHDCIIGNYAHIAPGVNLCGTVRVGERTLVGVGSSVRPEITIGSDTIIGAGSVVVNDIPSGVIAHGNPCKVIKEIK